MRAGEHVHFESKWWNSHKAKTLKGTKGGTLTRALTVYERGLAKQATDADSLKLKMRNINLALVGLDKAVTKTFRECDPRFHRETLDVLQQFPPEIRKKKTESTAVLELSWPLGVMAAAINSRGKDDEDDSNMISYIRWLRKQNPATQPKFISAVDHKIKFLQSTHLRVLKESIREHKTHLSRQHCTAVENCYMKIKKELNECRKLTADASKGTGGVAFPTRLAAIEKHCEAIVNEANRTVEAISL